MILSGYSLYDKVTNAFSDIKLCVNDDHAKREYKTMFQGIKDKPIINDIAVYRVLEFNTIDGTIQGTKEFLIDAKELVNYEE